MEFWQAFREFEFSNETMMVVGGLFVCIAMLQIVKSSLKLLFWVILAVVGAASSWYGYDKSTVRLPDNLAAEVRSIVGPSGLTEGMMHALCLRVLDSDQRSAPSNNSLSAPLSQ